MQNDKLEREVKRADLREVH